MPNRESFVIFFVGGIGGIFLVVCKVIFAFISILNGETEKLEIEKIIYQPENAVRQVFIIIAILSLFVIGGSLSVWQHEKMSGWKLAFGRAFSAGMLAPSLALSIATGASNPGNRQQGANSHKEADPGAPVKPTLFEPSQPTWNFRRVGYIRASTENSEVILRLRVTCDRCLVESPYISFVGVEAITPQANVDDDGKLGPTAQWITMSNENSGTKILPVTPSKDRIRLIIPDRNARYNSNDLIVDDGATCEFDAKIGDILDVHVTTGQNFFNNFAAIFNIRPYYIIRKIEVRLSSETNSKLCFRGSSF